VFLEFSGKQDLVVEADAHWLFDAFAWSLAHFGRDVFFDETVLVVPDNAHFPGRVDNAAGMAELIFDHVRRYAGMQHWPLRLADPDSCAVKVPPTLEIRGALRGSKGIAQTDLHGGDAVTLSYDPDLVANPEALIASFAHAVAHYLGQTSAEPPPGGSAYWPQAIEVLAVFMGFGLMVANSAFSVPVRSCGSCGGPKAQRRSYLTQYESTYALAIFSVLKGIPVKEVARYLKKPLRPFFRKCVKEIQGKRPELARLRSVSEFLPETGGDLVASS
jgi:hypothetical protein